jgi:hypothetical protein
VTAAAPPRISTHSSSSKSPSKLKAADVPRKSTQKSAPNTASRVTRAETINGTESVPAPHSHHRILDESLDSAMNLFLPSQLDSEAGGDSANQSDSGVCSQATPDKKKTTGTPPI